MQALKKLIVLALAVSIQHLHADALSELVKKRNRTGDTGSSQVTIDYFPDSPYFPEVRSSVEKLARFTEFLGVQMLVPDRYEVSMTRGQHYLEAACYPAIGKIDIDETAWATRQPTIHDGLLGHELGHLVFHATMMELLKSEIRWGKTSVESIKKIVSLDADLLEKTSRQSYPNWSIPNDDRSALDANANQFGMSQLLKAVIAAKRAADESNPFPTDLDGDNLLTHMLMESLGGFQEVFADLVGAVYTENPSYLTVILNDPLSRAVRDFNRQQPMSAFPFDMQRRLVTSASRGIPHLLLYELRQEIYHQFYIRNSTRIGANKEYDRAVLAQTMSALMRVFVKVFSQTPPKVKYAEATMALLYRQVVGDLLVEYEYEANALSSGFRLRRVYTAASARHQLSRLSQGLSFETMEELRAMIARSEQHAMSQQSCSEQVLATNERLERFRARTQSPASQTIRARSRSRSHEKEG